MAGGRPSKYDHSICDQLDKLYENGESVEEVCVELDISKETYYRWLKDPEKKEFYDAHKKAYTKSVALWARFGRLSALGLPVVDKKTGKPMKIKVDTTLWIYNMKVRGGKNWCEKLALELELENLKEEKKQKPPKLTGDPIEDAKIYQKYILNKED